MTHTTYTKHPPRQGNVNDLGVYDSEVFEDEDSFAKSRKEVGARAASDSLVHQGHYFVFFFLLFFLLPQLRQVQKARESARHIIQSVCELSRSNVGPDGI